MITLHIVPIFVKYHLDVVLCFQVRDYIHVVDLSDGHIAALRKLFDGSNIGRLPSLMSAIYHVPFVPMTVCGVFM